MKTLKIAAVLIAASASAFTFAPAFAQDAASDVRPGGHYEWRQVPQFGPKAPMTAPRRVWVPDAQQVANCNCAMMKMSAADCMMNMQGKPKAPSAG